MLKTVLRGLVPAAGLAALLALVLAPEVARAQDECGTPSNNEVTCPGTGTDMGTGDLGDGITYEDDYADGLKLTIKQRMDGDGNPLPREIKNGEISTLDPNTGNGIRIEGTHGSGTLHLVVEGDTNIVRRAAPSGTTNTSRNGIHIVATSTGSRPVLGSVMVELGSGVDIGADGEPFQDNGIRVDSERGGGSSPDSTGGISINNAGRIYANQRGIRALSRSKKVSGTSGLNGKVEITHSGLIKTGSHGIHAVSNGNADVEVTVAAGGSITATGQNAFGIFAQSKDDNGSSESGDVMVTSAGAIDVEDGQGIRAELNAGSGTLGVTISSGGTIMSEFQGIRTVSGSSAGATTIRVEAGATVTGLGRDQAVVADHHGIQVKHNGTAAVNIDVAGTVGTTGTTAGDAAIKIDNADSNAITPTTVTLRDNFRINGDILFDGDEEDDTLMLAVAENMRGEVMGKIMDVNTLIKNGPGTARLGDDVSFSGSTATINEGVLILRGHLNLGGGELTVKDGSKLAVEVGMDDDPDDDNPNHGRVTAGMVTIESGEIFVDYADGQEGAARARVNSGITVFDNANGVVPINIEAKLLHPGDTVATLTVESNGMIMGELGEERQKGPDPMDPDPMDPDPMDPMTPVTTPPSSGGGSGDSGSDNNERGFVVVSGMAMAFLLSNMFEAGAMGWSEDGGVWPGTAAHGFSSVRSGNHPDAKGLEYQVQLLDGAMPSPGMTAPVSAMSAAVRAHLGGGFHTELSATPKLAADGGRDAVSGSRYGLGLGWRSGVFSTDIGYSHAALDARSTFSNLEGLGELSGRYGLRHDQMQANAKLELDAGGMLVSPSVSLFGGKVSQEGYTASSRVWLSEVPSLSQEYAGWKAGLTMGSGSPLKGMGLRWRPELRLTTMRLASGDAGEMELVQRDRAGALRMQTAARASLPRTVHALGSGVTVAGGESWSVRGGYVALVADGEFEHAAGARFRLRF